MLSCALNFIDFCFILIQITISTVVMQNLAKLCLCFTKNNTKSAATVLSLMPSVGTSPINKKLFLWLSVWDDKVLSTPKIATFLAKSLP